MSSTPISVMLRILWIIARTNASSEREETLFRYGFSFFVSTSVFRNASARTRFASSRMDLHVRAWCPSWRHTGQQCIFRLLGAFERPRTFTWYLSTVVVLAGTASWLTFADVETVQGPTILGITGSTIDFRCVCCPCSTRSTPFSRTEHVCSSNKRTSLFDSDSLANVSNSFMRKTNVTGMQ